MYFLLKDEDMSPKRVRHCAKADLERKAGKRMDSDSQAGVPDFFSSALVDGCVRERPPLSKKIKPHICCMWGFTNGVLIKALYDPQARQSSLLSILQLISAIASSLVVVLLWVVATMLWLLCPSTVNLMASVAALVRK